ncbi:hypothetical protein [Treponema pectinovorum]|uniref:hypothetical protein n=1 Tax=Treponema pectinovorum TaxID=164 RepID=UPI0011CBB765|nr:hypothetical protein [Treponema pectinovorum]
MDEREKEIVKKIVHPLYTVEYLENWIKRNDNVFTNAPAALEACTAKGFYAAVRLIAKWERE